MGNTSRVSTNKWTTPVGQGRPCGERISQAAWIQHRRGARSRVVRARYDHRTAAAAWADRHEALTRCRSLDEVLLAARLNSDPVLAALLSEVSAGDQLAGRWCCRHLSVAWYGWRSGTRARVSTTISHIFGVIARYPLQRRPMRIAANLSMDTLKAVSRDHRWLGRGGVTLWPSSESLEELLEPTGLDGSPCDSTPPVDVEVCRVLEVSNSLRLIDDYDAALLRSIYADGMSGTKLLGSCIPAPA